MAVEGSRGTLVCCQNMSPHVTQSQLTNFFSQIGATNYVKFFAEKCVGPSMINNTEELDLQTREFAMRRSGTETTPTLHYT